VAWVKLHPAFNPVSPPGLDMRWASPAVRKALSVEILAGEFTTDWLFPALLVLAAFLWIEKKLVGRGLLT
jgi:hypothetical protein